MGYKTGMDTDGYCWISSIKSAVELKGTAKLRCNQIFEQVSFFFINKYILEKLIAKYFLKW